MLAISIKDFAICFCKFFQKRDSAQVGVNIYSVCSFRPRQIDGSCTVVTTSPLTRAAYATSDNMISMNVAAINVDGAAVAAVATSTTGI